MFYFLGLYWIVQSFIHNVDIQILNQRLNAAQLLACLLILLQPGISAVADEG